MIEQIRIQAPIPCFWLEPMAISRYRLRRYRSSAEADGKCSGIKGYHEAMGPLVAETPDDPSQPGICGTNAPTIEKDDPRWPTSCICGYQFVEADVRQVFADALYRRPDTGEIIELDHAPAGAMWDAKWWPDAGPDGICLMVKLPGGSQWMVDGHAAGCSGDHGKGSSHRCWNRTGTPPKVTASPSILVPNWHGWLRDGALHQA